jgi:hypothetical protein
MAELEADKNLLFGVIAMAKYKTQSTDQRRRRTFNRRSRAYRDALPTTKPSRLTRIIHDK